MQTQLEGVIGAWGILSAPNFPASPDWQSRYREGPPFEELGLVSPESISNKICLLMV